MPSIRSRARIEVSACFAGKMRGDVETVVHAVDEVDIYVSGWAEEDCIAWSETARCVGCRVDEAEVGFDFGDAGVEPPSPWTSRMRSLPKRARATISGERE